MAPDDGGMGIRDEWIIPTLVELPLAGNLVLPVGFLLLGDFLRSSSSKTCERKYCPRLGSWWFPSFFLVSMASFTHLLYLFCSVPLTYALSHPITWFFSTTWSVTADLWTGDSDCFLLSLVTADLLTFSISVLCSLRRVRNLRPVSPMYSKQFLMNCFLKNPQKGENQLVTPDFPQAEVQPVLVVAVSSSVGKEGRCP